ncbi:MAG: sigma-54 dependent transcriptional regulator [Planctomycetes bacterium]|nr:sigma-54 dependent transcriptional regulator [Planctomycetota bacterium]
MADPPIQLGSRSSLVGGSRALRRVLDLCVRVAPTRATVLITGETGTGKELIARYVHGLSPRRDQPLVACNCAACPETLLESELFGHVRGAFTGATNPRAGLFERAHAGTLLLDEVGDIPPPAQAKLLRVIQERRFSRLGATFSQEADVRIIASTHRDLLKEARRGQFREDLFYRLNVFPIHVPPLRERREDIAALARHLLEATARRNRCRQSGFTDEALALLIAYHWPGNVRQLQSEVERALLLTQGEPISERFLSLEVRRGYVPPEAGESATSLAYAQRLMLARALFENGWNYGKAARQLGVSVHVLRQMAARLCVRRTEQSV